MLWICLAFLYCHWMLSWLLLFFVIVKSLNQDIGFGCRLWFWWDSDALGRSRNSSVCCFFYFVVKIFDFTITSNLLWTESASNHSLRVPLRTIWRHNHFESAFCSCNFNWIECMTSFFTLSGDSFLFILLVKSLVTCDLLSKMTSSLWSWFFFTLI